MDPKHRASFFAAVALLIAPASCGVPDEPSVVWLDDLSDATARAAVGLTVQVSPEGESLNATVLGILSASAGDAWPAGGLALDTCGEAPASVVASEPFRRGSPEVLVDGAPIRLVRSDLSAGPVYTWTFFDEVAPGTTFALTAQGPELEVPQAFQGASAAAPLDALAADPIALSWEPAAWVPSDASDGRDFVLVDLVAGRRRVLCALRDDGAATLPAQAVAPSDVQGISGTIGYVREVPTTLDGHPTSLYVRHEVAIFQTGEQW